MSPAAPRMPSQAHQLKTGSLQEALGPRTGGPPPSPDPEDVIA